MPLPLKGIRVLDSTQALAGPHCSMMLAEYGADVIKLEPPSGDPTRSAVPVNSGGLSLNFAMHNRNKRSITLNLQSEKGKSLLHRLIPHFDVLIENYRPGVMARLGCGYDELIRYRPGLIMLSLSGFGQTGPYAQRSADDKIVQAMSGFMDLTGEEDGPPTKVAGSPSDYIAALYGAFAVSNAVLLGSLTGEGQYIDLSLLDGVVSTLASQVGSTWPPATSCAGPAISIQTRQPTVRLQPPTAVFTSRPVGTDSGRVSVESLVGGSSSIVMAIRLGLTATSTTMRSTVASPSGCVAAARPM